ncbi:type II toxin-antitoxin system death-on-curing family toxin [Opitutaceae bacterium EW11]|nr:type II toxin-antitoxin system death-on-curing family toxin [Opitutaceae bacterium EW11]
MNEEEPAFLEAEQVELLHRMSLERHGGQVGIRDRAAFDSAVMQPRNVWFYGQGDLFDVAAAYAFHVSQSQAFIDGNKRTGMSAALVFLEGNGVCVPEATDALYDAMIGIAERRMDRASVAALLRKVCRRSS